MSETADGQDRTVEPMDGESAAARAAARQVGLSIAPEDLAGVTAHLRLLMRFAAVVGDPTSEPAPVYRP